MSCLQNTVVYYNILLTYYDFFIRYDIILYQVIEGVSKA